MLNFSNVRRKSFAKRLKTVILPVGVVARNLTPSWTMVNAIVLEIQSDHLVIIIVTLWRSSHLNAVRTLAIEGTFTTRGSVVVSETGSAIVAETRIMTDVHTRGATIRTTEEVPGVIIAMIIVINGVVLGKYRLTERNILSLLESRLSQPRRTLA